MQTWEETGNHSFLEKIKSTLYITRGQNKTWEKTTPKEWSEKGGGREWKCNKYLV